MTLSPRTIALEGVSSPVGARLVALLGFALVEVIPDVVPPRSWEIPHPDWIRRHAIATGGAVPEVVAGHRFVGVTREAPETVAPARFAVRTIRVVPAVDLSYLRR